MAIAIENDPMENRKTKADSDQSPEELFLCEMFDQLATRGSMPARRLAQLLDAQKSEVLKIAIKSDWFNVDLRLDTISIKIKEP